MSRLSKVFELNPAGVNWPRAVLFLDVALVPLVVFWAIGYEEYLFSALFGALFAWLADPGGSYGQRVLRIAIFGLIGAGLTALGFGIGGDAWGWLTLAAFVVTLLPPVDHPSGRAWTARCRPTKDLRTCALATPPSRCR